MAFDTSDLLYPAILIGVMAFVEGLYLLVTDMRGGADKQVNRRLRVMAREADQRAAYDLLRPKALGEGASPWLLSILNSGAVRSLDRLIATSGIRLTTERTILFMVVGFAGVFAALDVGLRLDIFSSAVGGAVLAFGVPLFIISRIRRHRIMKFSAQLPDAIDMLVRSLRAGHPIPSGISLVAREMPDPIGSEFGLVFDGMAYGMELRNALQKMADRLALFEVDYMVVAMRIQENTGGNLAEILGSLASVIRERMNLRAKVRALSAEGRLAGKILSALPIAVVAGLLLINPHYYDAAKSSTGLAATLAFAVGLAIFGVVLLRRFVNIRV